MKKILVSKEKSGLRLDKFLAGEFFWLSRGEIIRNIRAGSVEINGRKVKPRQDLQEGDSIDLLFATEAPAQKLLPNADVKLDILYEDDLLLAINKPSGIRVHPDRSENYCSIANAVAAYLPEIASVHDGSVSSWMRPGIVHRLDKDTSGVMIIAKTQEALLELKKLFQKRSVTKEYLALVCGLLKEKSGVIEKEIARSADYRKQVIASAKTKTKIRPAVTRYEVVREYRDYSLVEARPKTGRMHQIRVHLASLGHPIAGDHVYGSKKTANCPGNKPKRQLLHAQRLEFDLLDRKYSFKAPLPPDFKGFLTEID